MKTADNLLAGIEFSLTGDMIGDYAQINGALIVGMTNNTELYLEVSSPHGIITPRTENFLINNVRFYNFNFNDAATLGSCSHCFHDAATDEGGRTVRFSNLYFDDTVLIKIRYQTPYSAIYLDLDGTLTGLGANTWATPHRESHMWDSCTHLEDEYDGVICDNTVEVRTIKFSTYTPSGLLDGMGLKMLRWDDDVIGAMDNTTLEEYLVDRGNYGTKNWKYKPSKNWATPFVTGHKYKIHWGVTGIDFEKMSVTVA
jgi:hypothetical protein